MVNNIQQIFIENYKFDIDKIANGAGNIIWLLLGGLILGITYGLIGVLYCCTIIGIPVGMQAFKLAKFCFHPCGYQIESGEGLGAGCISLILNIIWFFIGGLELALTHAVLGLILCITIIGLPFGIVHFQIARLALFPFGKSIEKE